MIVDDNKNGFDLPMISLCTENKVLFAKTKVIQYFGIEGLWQQNDEEIKKNYEEYGIRGLCREVRWVFYILYGIVESMKWRMNYCSNKFFQYYNKVLFDEMSFDEMNSMTFNTNELFECSTKVYTKSKTISNETNSDNCFGTIQTIKSIYANKEFGICYTFFSDNNNILLKDNDYLNIIIKFSTQKDYLIVGRPRRMEHLYMSSNRFFVWYFRVTDPDSQHRDTAIELNRVGFDARISLQMTTINLLSTPYMTYCVEDGKHIFKLFQGDSARFIVFLFLFFYFSFLRIEGDEYIISLDPPPPPPPA